VNNTGQIAGDRGANAATVQAFLWQNGNITNLGVLAGMTCSHDFGINAAGTVVGVSGRHSASTTAAGWLDRSASRWGAASRRSGR
jgi:probable HAF family extracellular repeat protein